MAEPLVRLNAGVRVVPATGLYADLALHVTSWRDVPQLDPANLLDSPRPQPLGGQVPVIFQVGYRIGLAPEELLETGLSVRIPPLQREFSRVLRSGHAAVAEPGVQLGLRRRAHLPPAGAVRSRTFLTREAMVYNRPSRKEAFMAEPEKMDKKKINIQIQLDDDVAQGAYVNLAMVNHSETEFILDFIYVQPQQPKARRCGRESSPVPSTPNACSRRSRTTSPSTRSVSGSSTSAGRFPRKSSCTDHQKRSI